MKIWVDDVRTPPMGYVWVRSVRQAKEMITSALEGNMHIDLLDMDHDAGDYAKFGSDYIKLLDWLEEKGYNFSIRIHSQNPVGIQNMRLIIERNGWKEIQF